MAEEVVTQDLSTLPDAEQDTAEAAGQDLGEWNERLDEELQQILIRLAREICSEFRYPRRLQIMKAWQGRSYWREIQHLNWNWDNDCWNVLGPIGNDSKTAEGQYDSAVMYSTNIYQGFGDSFIAIVTQAVPALRFEPEDPSDAADTETARASDDHRKLIQHENDPIKLMTKAAYYGWTDGLVAGWTRWETDKRTGVPRETQSVKGAMEVKVPLICDEQDQYPYVQFSEENHVATVRAKVRSRNFDDENYWKKIKGGATGNGQDVYERTARISVKQGISMRSAGGDTFAHLVTTQRTWMRPQCFYYDCVPEEKRPELESLFPSGCYLEVDNGVYTGSRDANLDDEWAIENIMEGDGSFRNAKGTCLVSVQERANDIINATQDVYEKTLPGSHWDDKIFDLDAMKRQRSMPGARYGANAAELQAGDAFGNHVFYEPAATVSPDMLGYLKELMTDVPQFLTGISAILFGADTGSDKSGKALSIQQAAAMGRVGLPFRVMKRWYAKMMEQAVRCGARNRKNDARIGIPDKQGKVETVELRIENLQGNVRCYAEVDENIPMSWSQKRAVYQGLLMEGNTDPQIRATLVLPQNQELGRRLIGLDDLEIAGADSWNKQMAEIALLLQEPPPPPQIQPPQPVPNPLQPETMEMIQPPPKLVSSVPIDEVYDDHAAEFAAVQNWINGPAGQTAKKENNEGFQNVRLHGIQHQEALQKKLAAAPPPLPVPAGKQAA